MIEKKIAGADDFDAAPETVGDLDHDWCVSFIIKQTHFTARGLGQASVQGPKTVGYLTQILLNCSLASKLTTQCRNKRVCFVALSKRCPEVGHRGAWM